MTMFTKQHYDFFAEYLGRKLGKADVITNSTEADEGRRHTAKHDTACLARLTADLGVRFMEDNPAFDVTKFVHAVDMKRRATYRETLAETNG